MTEVEMIEKAARAMAKRVGLVYVPDIAKREVFEGARKCPK